MNEPTALNMLDGIIPTLISPVSIAMQIEEDEREERRQKRIDLCGSAGARIDVYTMTWYTYRMACGYWRRCETCFRTRVAQFKAWYRIALQQCEGDIKGILVDSKKAAASVVKELRSIKVEYKRLPIEEGIVILYDGFYDGLESNYPTDNLDWDTLAWTPEGSRYSGRLGKSKESKEEDTSESFIVQIPELYFSLPRGHTHQEAYNLSQKRTGDLSDLEFNEVDFNMSCYYLGVNLREIVEEWGGKIVHECIASKRMTLNSFKAKFVKEKEVILTDQEPPPGFVEEDEMVFPY